MTGRSLQDALPCYLGKLKKINLSTHRHPFGWLGGWLTIGYAADHIHFKAHFTSILAAQIAVQILLATTWWYARTDRHLDRCTYCQLTYRRNWVHTVAAADRRHCRRPRPCVPRSPGIGRGYPGRTPCTKHIPAGATRAPPAAASQSLCPCRPPSAGTRDYGRCWRRTAHWPPSRSPVGWRSPPPEPPPVAGWRPGTNSSWVLFCVWGGGGVCFGPGARS